MIRAFAWGVIVGAAAMVMLFGHNGWLVEPVEKHVSPRFSFLANSCTPDWPQYAKVCQYIDGRGNRIIHTIF